MRRNRTLLIGGALALAVVGGGAGIAVGAGGDDDRTERAITGPALADASAAALAHTGGGRVTDSEVGDEEGAYEVEVTLDDGTQVDVHLDEELRVLGTEGDGTDDEEDEGEDEEEGLGER